MTPEEPARPYPPSWVDRFTDWLENLPGPSWLAYLVFYILLGTQNHLVVWISGETPWGSFDPILFIYQLFTAEVLFFLSYLNRDAARALEAFCPLLDVSAEELSRLKYRLSHQPARPVFLLTLAGIILGSYYAYTVSLVMDSPLPVNLQTIYGAIGFGLPMVLALVFCYRIVVQLRTVTHLYATAPELDLFNLEPVYALSTHTAKTGLIFLFLIYSNLLLSPESIMVPTALITTVAISILSFAAFVLPLGGVNRRLVAEKKTALRQINARIKQAFARFENMFDQGELGGMPELEKTILNLQYQKAFIEKIPTWPWQPTTMRGFLSAMLLPILIWIVQQVLARFFIF